MDKINEHIDLINKQVAISKTDLITGEEIEGATLIVKDDEGNIVDEWISTKEVHYVKGLEEGKHYQLIEITSPYGYEIAETVDFTVTKEKVNELIEMKDKPILLVNIQINKLDADTKMPIIDNYFEFGIYEDEECTKLIKKATTDISNGTAIFEDLKYGTYFIKEDIAPSKYQLLDKIIKLEINDEGVFVDNEKLEKEDDVYGFEYYNTKIPDIQTGNETNYVLLMSLAIISLIGICASIIILRKNN